MLKCRLVKYCLAFVSVLLIVACASPEKKLADRKCGACHSTEIAFKTPRTEYQWKVVVDAMKVRGMKTTAIEDQQILKYLTEKHGK